MNGAIVKILLAPRVCNFLTLAVNNTVLITEHRELFLVENSRGCYHIGSIEYGLGASNGKRFDVDIKSNHLAAADVHFDGINTDAFSGSDDNDLTARNVEGLIGDKYTHVFGVNGNGAIGNLNTAVTYVDTAVIALDIQLTAKNGKRALVKVNAAGIGVNGNGAARNGNVTCKVNTAVSCLNRNLSSRNLQERIPGGVVIIENTVRCSLNLYNTAADGNIIRINAVVALEDQKTAGNV